MQHQGGGGEGVDEGNEAWSEITLKLRPFLQFTGCLESGDIPPHPHLPKTICPFILKLHHRSSIRWTVDFGAHLVEEVKFSCFVAYVIETSRVEAKIEQN
ncbi:hypothetical protein NC651_033395 [Populus alba x Populus x berolinensis]|nr:hypothetical protein NC651_033395 [Populus alba x Populus x berolinensis]